MSTEQGTPGQEARSDGNGLERLLAEANLARMRGHWPDAEAGCVKVLRADPNNLHAHSLLGDIYRDQGRSDDALQWYRLALDLAPSSAADREKLLRLETDIREAEGRSLTASADSHEPPVPLRQFRWLTAAIIVVAIAAGTITLSATRRAPHPAPSKDASGVKVSPVTGPAARPDPLGRAPQAAQAAAPRSVEPARQIDADLRLEAGLATRADLTRGMRVLAVSASGGGAVLALGLPQAASGAAMGRNEMLRGALASAAFLLNGPASPGSVQVMVMDADGQGLMRPLFRGVVTRAALQAGSNFASTWWSPSAEPSGPATSGESDPPQG
ncbi:MAG: tetratricopeptide repeat protein [Armatimonadetes bacterium]|nr:tetratricopeptide repeat protein [Armatimonadota bacterium]